MNARAADTRELRATIEMLWSRFLRSLKREAVGAIVDVVHAGGRKYEEPSDEFAECDDHDEFAAGDVDPIDVEPERDRDAAQPRRRGRRGGRRHRRRSGE